MTNYEMLAKREYYYKKIFVAFELLKAMKDREVTFISVNNPRNTIRGLMIRNIEMLYKIFDIYHFFNKDYSIYVSCAKYNKLPIFTWDLTKRSSETSRYFFETARNDIIDYDILLDFDSKIIPYALMLIEIKSAFYILSEAKIKFNCFFSGNNFQFIIYGDQILNENKVEFAQIFVEKFKKKYKLISLDLIGVGSLTKVRKCEYSLVNDRVCFPLDNLKDIEALIHIYKNFDSNILLSMKHFKNRGLKIQNPNSSVLEFGKFYSTL